MKKIIPFIVLGIVVVLGGIMLLSKPKARTPTGRTSRRSGKTAGQIKPRSEEQLVSEKRKLRAEERARKREIRRRLREQRRAQRLAARAGRYGYGYSKNRLRSRRGVASGARSSRKSGATLYQLRGIISIENTNYALIDNQQYKQGDMVMGRRIDNVYSDRIIINDAGKTREVKIGEMCFPNLITQTKRTRR